MEGDNIFKTLCKKEALLIRPKLVKDKGVITYDGILVYKKIKCAIEYRNNEPTDIEYGYIAGTGTTILTYIDIAKLNDMVIIEQKPDFYVKYTIIGINREEVDNNVVVYYKLTDDTV